MESIGLKDIECDEYREQREQRKKLSTPSKGNKCQEEDKSNPVYMANNSDYASAPVHLENSMHKGQIGEQHQLKQALPKGILIGSNFFEYEGRQEPSFKSFSECL
jgi:hypothetical protein